MRKFGFMTAAVAVLFGMSVVSCKQEEKEEKPLVVEVTEKTADVPGQMADFIEPLRGEYTVIFSENGEEASVTLDVETLKQVLYTEDLDIQLDMLDSDRNPIGDFATLGLAEPKTLAKRFKKDPGKEKLKFTSEAAGIKLNEEQVETLKEKAKYLKVSKAEGIHDWYFIGAVGGKYPIHMSLSADLTEGSYYYDKSGVHNPMWLTLENADFETGTFIMTERNSEGLRCGYWEGKMTPEHYSGTCFILLSGKEYRCVLDRYNGKPKPNMFSPTTAE